MSYCQVAHAHPSHRRYHDIDYGFPLRDDAALFERLALEINQAGLSWLTILNKRDAFRHAYEGFDLDRVAAYGAEERARLLADARIIRNRLKVDAVIENARRLQAIRAEHGSFAAWLDAQHAVLGAATYDVPSLARSRDEWRRLFKRTFVFTGGEIVGEFLISTGYLPGAHQPDCPIYAQVAALRPPWMRPGRDNSSR